MMTQSKPKNGYAARSKVRGFTLVELMIAITLGLVLVAGVAYTYLGNRATYRLQDGLARMQEGARHAFEVLDFDIRMTGFTGCTASETGNIVNPSASVDGNLFTQSLTGYEDVVGTIFPTTIAASRLRGDAISVLRANTDTEYIVSSHVPTSAVIGISTPNDLEQGEILIITDCVRASTFQKSNPNSSPNPPVVHNTGNAISPGNCTKGFGPDPLTGQPNCSVPDGVEYPYAPPKNSRIYRLSGNTYYIGTNAAGQPALFRQRLTQSGGNAATVAEELVEGVEDMQISYGVDRSNPADKIVDIYVPANLVSAAATPGTTFSDKWQRALSVKITLLLSSTENNITTVSQPYTFNNGASVTPTDRRLRKVFTTTIAIRNRL